MRELGFGSVWATVTAATGKVLQILPIEGRSAFPVWMPSGDAVAYIETHDARKRASSDPTIQMVSRADR